MSFLLFLAILLVLFLVSFRWNDLVNQGKRVGGGRGRKEEREEAREETYGICASPTSFIIDGRGT